MKENAILISRSYCNNITLGIQGAALLLPLLFPSTRTSFLNYLSTAALISFVGGFLASLWVGRLITSRLKARLSEWRREIEAYGFGRFWRTRGPKHEAILQQYIDMDPDCEQITRERRLSQIYAALWVYPPMLVLLGLIVYFASLG